MQKYFENFDYLLNRNEKDTFKLINIVVWNKYYYPKKHFSPKNYFKVS